MPVPYRRTPRAAEVGQAAYLDIVWLGADRVFYGGLLIIDGKGQPLEFVHNQVAAPLEAQLITSDESASGLLWPERMVRQIGIPLLTHSLFDACRREPDLLVCLPTLGTPEFCSAEIAPSLPFAQVVPPQDDLPMEWNWINTPPSSAMRATILSQELVRRGFTIEPFERLQDALRLVYPQASWNCLAEYDDA